MRIFYHAAENEALVGDNSKMIQELGWKQKIKFSDIVKEMVDADLKAVSNELRTP